MNNVLIIGDNITRIAKLKQDLATLLHISSLGEAKFLLGIEVIIDRSERPSYLERNKIH